MARKKSNKPAALPILVALEITPVSEGYTLTARAKVPGKGGPPRKLAYDRVFKTLAAVTRAAEDMRKAHHAACEIEIKE